MQRSSRRPGQPPGPRWALVGVALQPLVRAVLSGLVAAGLLGAGAAVPAAAGAQAPPAGTGASQQPAVRDDVQDDQHDDQQHGQQHGQQGGPQDGLDLQQEVVAQSEAVVRAQGVLLELSEQAQRALEAHEQALRDRDVAQAEEQAQLERLVTARALLGAKRSEMGRWASRTYREGGVLGDYEQLMSLLSSHSTDDLGQRMVTLRRIGRMRGEVVTTVTQAKDLEQDAARRAEVAAIGARAAAERAEAARLDADALVASQTAQVAVLEQLLSSSVGAAERAGSQEAQLAAARAEAERRAASADGVPDAAGGAGSCTGGDVARYPNGAIPLEVLCPLWGAPGHHLRADAASGFNRLSEAYAAEYGEPLCVTDSYRRYDSQLRLKAEKPHLAATPGTSNHGWGTAVDLCGGVQSFGSPAHEWMRRHAPLHGFFHPRWARADGSKPEPWHWEFAG